MEHAKRMVLVPEGSAFRVESHPTVQTPGNSLSRLDSAMSGILYSENFEDQQAKWLAYQNILDKYLQKKGVYTQSHQQTDARREGEEEDRGKDALETSVMLHSVAKTYRPKAKDLIEFMSKTSNIKWTKEGRMIIDDVELPNSNIRDLLNDAARERKKTSTPNGRAQLSAALRKAGVPKKLIGNNRFWEAGEASLNNTAGSPDHNSTLYQSGLSASSPKETSQHQQKTPSPTKWNKWH